MKSGGYGGRSAPYSSGGSDSKQFIDTKLLIT